MSGVSNSDRSSGLRNDDNLCESRSSFQDRSWGSVEMLDRPPKEKRRLCRYSEAASTSKSGRCIGGLDAPVRSVSPASLPLRHRRLRGRRAGRACGRASRVNRDAGAPETRVALCTSSATISPSTTAWSAFNRIPAAATPGYILVRFLFFLARSSTRCSSLMISAR